jgi:Glycine/D-amino acid oxidases (deaminating)
MDLHTYYPYSLMRYGFIHSYPSLKENIQTDVAIIGAGISGALAAYYLNQAGVQCTLFDKGHVAMGSTAASTSLIQYEIDVPLYKLIKLRGEKTAIRSYLLCRDAIYELKKISDHIDNQDNFDFKFSLQFASFKKDIQSLEKEYRERKRIGLKLVEINEDQLKNEYGLSASFAILSHEAAELDIYLFTHRLLKYLSNNYCNVYDHTAITSLNKRKKSIQLKTSEGNKIDCKHVIIACGYESSTYLKKAYDLLRTTYVIASEPNKVKQFWPGNCLIWETADPYVYLKISEGNRILIGGKDTDYMPINKQQRILSAKANSLHQRFKQLFPELDFKIDFQWAGAFSTTKDGLPYIGALPGKENIYYALGYGGNGIIFSVIAGQMISNSITGNKTTDIQMFSFNR